MAACACALLLRYSLQTAARTVFPAHTASCKHAGAYSPLALLALLLFGTFLQRVTGDRVMLTLLVGKASGLPCPAFFISGGSATRRESCHCICHFTPPTASVWQMVAFFAKQAEYGINDFRVEEPCPMTLYFMEGLFYA